MKLDLFCDVSKAMWSFKSVISTVMVHVLSWIIIQHVWSLWDIQYRSAIIQVFFCFCVRPMIIISLIIEKEKLKWLIFAINSLLSHNGSVILHEQTMLVVTITLEVCQDLRYWTSWPLYSLGFTAAANHSNKPYGTKTDSFTSYDLMLAPLFSLLSQFMVFFHRG